MFSFWFYENSSCKYQGVAEEVGKGYKPWALAHKTYSNHHDLEASCFGGQFILQLHAESFTCQYLKYLVLNTSSLDGSLLLVHCFAILCCIMYQGKNGICFPVTGRCPHRHFKCTIYSKLCSVFLQAESISEESYAIPFDEKRPHYSSDNNVKLSLWFNERQDVFAVILLFVQSEISYNSKNQANSQLCVTIKTLNLKTAFRFMFHFVL